MVVMGWGQRNGRVAGQPDGHAMGTVWWACGGDSAVGMMRTA